MISALGIIFILIFLICGLIGYNLLNSVIVSFKERFTLGLFAQLLVFVFLLRYKITGIGY